MNAPPNLQRAKERLDNLRRMQRSLALTASLYFIIAAVLITLVCVLVLEVNFHFNPLMRYVLLSVILLVAGGGFGAGWYRIFRNPTLRSGRQSEEYWAMRLGEKAYANLQDRLLNALQINQNQLSKKDGQSEELARQALYQAVDKVAEIDDVNVIDDHSRKHALKIAMISVVVSLVTLASSPVNMRSALSRILSPATVYSVPPAFTLEVSHETGWAYRGEQVEFIVKASGHYPAEVEFVYNYPKSLKKSTTVRLSDGMGLVTFEQFSKPVTYFVRADNIRSESYLLDVVTRPNIAEMRYRLFSPRYSRLPVKRGDENVGDVEALAGSRMEVTIRATHRLADAFLIFLKQNADSSKADTVSFEVKDHQAIANLHLYKEGSYHISILDWRGHTNRDPISSYVRIIDDEDPTISIEYPDTDIDLGDAMEVPLEVAADDDYGVSTMKIQFSILNDDTTIEEFDLPFERHNTVNAVSHYLWDISNLSVFPGDVIEYWAVCFDNDNVRGPKRAESQHRLIRLPTFEEIVSGVEDVEEAGLQQAEDALETAKELREEVSEVIEEMRRNPEMNWDRQQQIESALQKQDALQDQVDKIGKQIDELIQRLEKNDLLTTETLEKYQELQELIAEIATPELKAAMEKLQEAMAQQDPEKIREALEQFDLDREDYLERIERSLSIFKQLQLERKLDELARLAEELLHNQEEIIDQIGGSDDNQLANREDALANSMQSFEKNIATAMELANEAGEDQLALKLDSILTEAEKKGIDENMRRMSSELRTGESDKALKSGEQAARDISSLSASLNQTAIDLKEKRKNELARKLRKLTEDLLYLSEDQESLSIESKNLGTHSPRYRSLSNWQESIRGSLLNVANRLFEISKETFFITPSLGAALGNANSEIDKSIAGYSERNPRTVNRPQSKAIASINSAVNQLLDIQAQLEGSSSASGFEEMMERLNQMASQQQSLNQQSMMMPGAQGEQMQSGGQFERLAAQQRALQKQMQEMAEDAGQDMEEILGDLEGIANSMNEVAGDFEDKQILERTRRLQRQIVSRLLDATRSVKEREYSKKRKSRAGFQIVRPSLGELELGKSEDELRQDMLRALQEGYTRDYRKLIKEYFERLEELDQNQRR